MPHSLAKEIVRTIARRFVVQNSQREFVSRPNQTLRVACRYFRKITGKQVVGLIDQALH